MASADVPPGDAAPPVARPAQWRWRAPCGDELERAGDSLVLSAAFPIEGLELSRFRNPVLRVRGERFTLASVEGDARRPTYRFLLEVPNLYAPPGELVIYDAARHLDRARERRHTALAWLLFLPMVPLTPLLGLLPERAKERLAALGFDPTRASRLSLFLEWALIGLLVLAYLFSGGFFTLPGAILGALCLLLVADVAFRVASDYDGRAPGFLGVLVALRAWVVDSWRALRGRALPPSEDAREPPPTDRP